MFCSIGLWEAYDVMTPKQIERVKNTWPVASTHSSVSPVYRMFQDSISFRAGSNENVRFIDPLI